MRYSSRSFFLITFFILFQISFVYGKERFYNITTDLVWNKWIDNYGNRGEIPSLIITEQERMAFYMQKVEKEDVSFMISGKGGARALLWSITDDTGSIISSSGKNAIVDNEIIKVKKGQTFITNLSLNAPFFLKSTIKGEERIKNMKLLFFDDFQRLDTTIWGAVHFEATNYASVFKTTNQNCFVRNGKLNLTIDRVGDRLLSPYLSTGESLSIKKGRFEARIRLKRRKHNNFLWCFFSFGQNADWPEALEFDVIEKTKNSISVNTHWSDNGSHCTDSRNVNSNSSSWHVYAVDWDEKGVSYSIDNEIISYLPAELLGETSLSRYPMDIRFNVKAFDKEYDDNSMMVDWIKVYEQIDSCTTNNPTNDDIVVAKGQSVYLQSPRNDLANNAFIISAKDNKIIQITNSRSYKYGPVVHEIKGLQKGTIELLYTYPDQRIIKKRVVVY